MLIVLLAVKHALHTPLILQALQATVLVVSPAALSVQQTQQAAQQAAAVIAVSFALGSPQ